MDVKNLCCMYLDCPDSLGEFLKSNKIFVNLVDMPGTVQGFVYISMKNEYHIVINNNLSPTAKLQTFMHEFKHIIEDCPKMCFIIGLDAQGSDIEREADIFAENFIKTLKTKMEERRASSG